MIRSIRTFVMACGIAKLMTNGLAYKSEKNKPILKAKLGYESIDEYMRADLKDILSKQKGEL